MMKIWKYVVPGGGEEDGYRVEIPKDGKIVKTYCETAGSISFWTLFDPNLVDRGDNLMMEPRWFRVFGTGHTIPEGWNYIGTGFAWGLVWHLFERTT